MFILSTTFFDHRKEQVISQFGKKFLWIISLKEVDGA